MLQLHSNSQDRCPFDCRRCTNNQNGNFSGKNIKFSAKKWVFAVFTPYCTKSLRKFTVVLRWCANLQDGRLFNWARCATNKMDNFIRRKKVLGQKTSKKWVFWGRKKVLGQKLTSKKVGFLGKKIVTHYCTKSLRNFTVVLRWCSNLQDSRPF